MHTLMMILFVPAFLSGLLAWRVTTGETPLQRSVRVAGRASLLMLGCTAVATAGLVWYIGWDSHWAPLIAMACGALGVTASATGGFGSGLGLYLFPGCEYLGAALGSGLGALVSLLTLH